MTKQKKNKQIIIVVSTIAALLVLFAILEKTGVTNLITLPKDAPVAQGPTPEQKQTDDAVNAATKEELLKNDAKVNEPTPTTPTQSSNSIALSAQQEGNSSVTVFTKLYGYSSGSCTLLVSNGSKNTTQNADIIYQPEYSSCAGFSVPIDAVGKGTWTIKLSTTSPNATDSKTITFEVK